MELLNENELPNGYSITKKVNELVKEHNRRFPGKPTVLENVEVCDNPDHYLIEHVDSELQRLGCPVCGHDKFHRIKSEQSPGMKKLEEARNDYPLNSTNTIDYLGRKIKKMNEAIDLILAEHKQEIKEKEEYHGFSDMLLKKAYESQTERGVPKCGTKYWYINFDGDACCATWTNYDTDLYLLHHNNVWFDKAELDRYLKIDKKFRKLIWELNQVESNRRYYIYLKKDFLFEADLGSWCFDITCKQEFLDKAIELIGEDDLKWYIKNYRA